MLMVTVTNFNVQWYSDSEYVITGISNLLRDPTKDAFTGSTHEDMWATAAEIVAQFKRFFTIDCRYVPAHFEGDEVGPLITPFEFHGNKAAEEAAKEGARMRPDFLRVKDGMAMWEIFAKSVGKEVLER